MERRSTLLSLGTQNAVISKGGRPDERPRSPNEGERDGGEPLGVAELLRISHLLQAKHQ